MECPMWISETSLRISDSPPQGSSTVDITRTYYLHEVMSAMKLAYGEMTENGVRDMERYLLDTNTFPMPYEVIKTKYGTLIADELRSLSWN